MANVESLTSSVVREYLSRKGLRDTLAMLDKEMPRTDECISNRAQLAKELHINGLMKKNKESRENFRTMLEVIIQFVAAKAWIKLTSQTSTEKEQKTEQTKKIISPRERQQEEHIESKQDFHPKETAKNSLKNSSFLSSETQRTKSGFPKEEFNMGENSLLERGHDEKLQLDHSGLSVSHGQIRTARTRTRTASSEDLALDREKNSEQFSGRKRKDNLEWDFGLRVEDTPSRNKTRNRLKNDANPAFFSKELGSKDSLGELSRRQGGFDKEECSEQDSSIHTTITDKSRNKEIQPGASSYVRKSASLSSKGPRRHAGSVSGTIMSTGLHSSRKNDRNRYFGESLAEDFDKRPERNTNFKNASSSKNDRRDDPLANDHRASAFAKQENKTEKHDWKKAMVTDKDVKKSGLQTNSSSATKKSSEELTFEDVDDNLDEELSELVLDVSRKPAILSTQGRPITLKLARELKIILFGSSTSVFNQEWRIQGFSFCDIDRLKYGIVQHKGGPCGLLASVQAVLLKLLLFGDDLTHSSTKKHLRFSSKETKNALCLTLTEILWRAGCNKEARVALRSEKAQFLSTTGYKPDNITEKLIIYEFHNQNELESFIKENINQLSSDQESGSILFLYSVILSRTVEKIREDMDDPEGTLMGAHGYCTQDMVNLLLTGKSVSNTFDNVIELGDGGETKNVLKGVDKQSDIGLLSLFEYYKSCVVGSNLKNPRYPIWVVCSESHFSVLFSLKRSILNERRPLKTFDLYYYDGLARQDEEIRLTVDLTAELKRVISEDLTPPLELCIRTRWKDAVVDWNGTEPLL